MKKIFGFLKKALSNMNSIPVYKLGHVEKTPRFEYEVKNDNGWVLDIKFIGMELSMKEEVHLIAYAGENVIKKESLYYGRMGEDEISVQETISLKGIDAADKVCIRYIEGMQSGGGDEAYHSFGKFCIDL